MLYTRDKQEGYRNVLPGYLENRLAGYNSFINTSDYKSESKEEYISKPANDIVNSIFSDKTKTSKSTVRELLAEIKRRDNLHNDIKSKIDDDICRCDTYLHEVRFWTERNYNPDTNFLRRRTSLEGQIFTLDEQKRIEDVNHWRDTMFLRKYLMSALKDYWNAFRKNKILTSLNYEKQ
jgi:hypothetical protein